MKCQTLSESVLYVSGIGFVWRYESASSGSCLEIFVFSDGFSYQNSLNKSSNAITTRRVSEGKLNCSTILTLNVPFHIIHKSKYFFNNFSK